MKKKRPGIISILKAARSDFLPASMIPFFIGAVYALNRGFPLSASKLILGLTGVITAHLSANLLNDYYDNKSGADDRSKKISPYFGGSRVIQEGLFTDKEILKFSLFFLSIALLCGIGIFAITKDPLLLVFVIIGCFLAVEYTAPPLKMAYNRLGEFVIFLLFGVGLVMGSFYLFSGKLTFGSLLVSLPIAFLIMSVIICNEVPDFGPDISVKKSNLLSVSGVRYGYILYGAVILFSLLALLLNIMRGVLPFYAAFIGVIYVLGVKAFLDLKHGLADMNRLIQASRLTIIQHALVGLALILVLVIS